MDRTPDQADADFRAIRSARGRGPIATLRTFVKLSGPGWLQSAITLGGGSLANSLYLGVLAGFSMLWLQPLAMALGIVMLSAIAYVTLSTGERPFRAIVTQINPVLGWGWALATLAANMVWSLPQYSLATGVVQQNLLPGVLGPAGPLGEGGGKLAICTAILVVTVAVTWSYDRGSFGIRLYERLLKGMVALIVLCFAGVVVRLGLSSDAGDSLPWGTILRGFVPDIGQLSEPAAGFAPLLAGLAEDARRFWTAEIVGMQRDVMIGAAATAVGINMTFLLPYSMLARGWNREFRGLARFDLLVGMLIPFLLATSCVVVASASRFHAEPVPGLVVADAGGAGGAPATAAADVDPKLVRDYRRLLAGRVRNEVGGDAFATLPPAELRQRQASLPLAEQRLAAMLVKRDAFDLAKSLRPLTGDLFADILFGLGVLGMALSTITLLMLISGFVICEMLGLPPTGWSHRLGTLAAATGVLGPFLWTKASFYLAVPTSVFGMALLPIAYWTFFLMMNSPALLGADMPRGANRIAWNALMLPAAGLATFASLWSIVDKAGAAGLATLAAFLGLAVVVHLRRRR